ncbi:uncharacterized protein N7482_009979 [Penicillium canariense]|uniref:Uncharacterized protein n=1 Tax=Penicillium canariense TaxID=189055 RepID=A0A9W9LFG2_9EURO|nr:uncharacterized protein N7482_009979 [Penicillium canariense]KAJ5153501.1 hypothetical protein N7482_009979 [Penicillium canariense]
MVAYGSLQTAEDEIIKDFNAFENLITKVLLGLELLGLEVLEVEVLGLEVVELEEAEDELLALELVAEALLVDEEALFADPKVPP